MINLKKIASVLASVAMVGSTMGLAAAAAFPAPFVSNGAGDVGIVYGKSDDFTAATNIGTNLAKSITSTVATPTGESVLFEKSSTKLRLGRTLLEVSTAAIDDENPNGGLPTLLAEGTYVDDDNDEFDYTQKIDLGVLNLTMWEDSEYQEDEPTLGIKLANNDHILNYTLDFTDEPLWDDLTTTDITLMGKNYFILSITNGTTLNLLDAAQSTTLAEGESTQLTIGGVAYDITLEFVGSSTARFNVNGQKTNALSAGDTQKIAGAYVGVKAIDSQDYSGGVKNVEFALGTGKLELVNNQDIEINDVAVSDLQAYMTNGASSTSPYTTLAKLVIEWNADDDLFITESSEVSMPGFEAVKFSFTGMTYPTEETIEVAALNEDVIYLNDFPLKTSTEDINLVMNYNSSRYIANMTGKDENNQLMTTNETSALFNESIHDYFVASWDDGNEAESYLVTVDNFAVKSSSAGTSEATFKYKKDGSWATAKVASNGDVVTIGNIELTVGNVSKEYGWANFSTGSNVKLNTLYSKEGMKMWLPWVNNTNVGSPSGADGGGAISGTSEKYPGFMNGTEQGLRAVNLTFQEEDYNEIPAGGDGINLTLGFNSASTPEVSVTGVTIAHSGSSTEIQDTDVFRNFVYSALGTEILWDKPSSGQQSVKMIYHGGESYGSVYLSSAGSVAGGATGVVPVLDSAVSGVQSKNLIVVGGSCVNTVARTLVAPTATAPLCEADWTQLTGVGAGEYLIKTYANPYAADKIAVLVAGYEKADTASAANYLTTNSPDVSIVGYLKEGPQ